MILKSEAIVFKKKNLPGQDTLITLFTQEEGKITAFAKGVKKLTSRRSPHMQTGNLVTVQLQERNGRYFIQETNLKSGFSAIKTDPQKIEFQYVVLYLLDRMLPEKQVELPVYSQTKRFLISLARSEEFSKVNLKDHLQILFELLGYHKEVSSLSELFRYAEEIIHEKIPASIV